MRKFFEEPKLLVVNFNVEDVVTTSNGSDPKDPDEGDRV